MLDTKSNRFFCKDEFQKIMGSQNSKPYRSKKNEKNIGAKNKSYVKQKGWSKL